MDILRNKKLILGSGSPRRSQILTDSLIPFTKIIYSVLEEYPDDLPVIDVPEYLAKLKSDPFRPTLKKDEIVLTADTIVILENNILGKPKDRNEAVEVLHALSNKAHDVITGICMISLEKEITRKCISTVHFSSLSEEEIEYYVDTCTPFDKAGSYGIQDWIGNCKIEKIEGSYLNIMGLPVHLIYEELRKW